jgi:16S rRNA (adenine1518-N6/adenine1519-N6)-dimethyltransferase
VRRIPGESRPPAHPRKRFGQHFLEKAWIDKVVAVVAPRPDQVFLEIGPGRGALTRPLVERARHVLAFEVDRDLAAALRMAGHPNLTVIEGDFLDVTASGVRDGLRSAGLDQLPIRVVGNLPYNISSPILFKLRDLVEATLPIPEAIVMLQREVANRIVARPGTSDYGVLAVLLQHVAEVDRLLSLPPGAFRPPPEVHSSLIRLRWHAPAPMPIDLDVFGAVTRAVFTRRRKMLANALLAFALPTRTPIAALIDQAGLDPRQRPETLDIPDFVRLADAVASVLR